MAQNKLTLAMANHYKSTHKQFKQDTFELETKMQQTLSNTQNREVRVTHYKMQLKTMNNILNMSEEIEQRKKRKLDNLNNPNPKRSRQDSPTTSPT